MKANCLFTNTFAGLAVAAVLFASASRSRADDTTNIAASPATNRFGLSLSIDTDDQNAGAQNYFGLPKEAFDRLSPEQIVELAQAHQKTFATEQIPDLMKAILIPAAMFTMIAVCVGLGVNARLKRTRLLHETIRLMIEKGQPIPTELLTSPEKAKQPRNDLLYGLIFSGIGLALMIFFLTIVHGFSGPWAIGLIPLFIGIAFLIIHKLERNGPPK